MKVLLFLAAFVVAGLCAGGPDLDSNFTATVNFDEKFGHESHQFQGTWYMDALGRQERFNAQSKRGLVDFFRFFNTSLAFEFMPKSGACTKHTVPGTFYPVFGWLKYAKETGACRQIKGGHRGKAWKFEVGNHDRQMVFDLCVDETGKIPYWTEMKGHNHGQEFSRFADFSKYTPGQPPASVFTLPQQCNKFM